MTPLSKAPQLTALTRAKEAQKMQMFRRLA